MAFISVLPVLLYLPFLHEPFERDEGTYATIAQNLRTHLPYKDLFDHKPPLIYLWYFFAFLFSDSVVAPRLLAAIMFSLTVPFVYLQGLELGTRRLAFLAAVFFSLSAGLARLQANANTEIFMLLPLVASLLAFFRAMKFGSMRWFAASGFLVGLAILTKQVAAWNFLALTAVGIAWGFRSFPNMRQRLTPVLCFAAGCGLVLGAAVLVFALLGGLNEFLYANVVYNFLYASDLTDHQRLHFLEFAVLFPFLMFAPLIPGSIRGCIVLIRRKGLQGFTLVAWSAASAIGVSSGGRYFPHYFVEMLPAVAILAAVGIDHYLSSPAKSLRTVPLAVAWACAAMLPVIFSAQIYLKHDAIERHIAKFPPEKALWEVQSSRVGAFLREGTSSNETIYNYGRETQIYYYAHRQPAVRDLYDRPLWLDKSALDQTIAELRKAAPAYIVDTALPPIYPASNLYHPQPFVSFLEENYDYVGKVEFADVYKRKVSDETK